MTLAAGAAVYYAIYQLYLPVKIIVPNKVIEEKQLITAKDLKENYISLRDKHKLAVANPAQVVGKYTTVKLYPEEQILTERLSSDPGAITGAFSYLTPNETYVTFHANEVRWPKGVKTGDTLTAIAVTDTGTEKIAEKLKVIGTEEPNTILDPIKQAGGQSSSKSITVSMDRAICDKLLDRKVKSKEFYFLPEHPNMMAQSQTQTGGENVEPKSAGTAQASKGKRTR